MAMDSPERPRVERDMFEDGVPVPPDEGSTGDRDPRKPRPIVPAFGAAATPDIILGDPVEGDPVGLALQTGTAIPPPPEDASVFHGNRFTATPSRPAPEQKARLSERAQRILQGRQGSSI